MAIDWLKPVRAIKGLSAATLSTGAVIIATVIFLINSMGVAQGALGLP